MSFMTTAALARRPVARLQRNPVSRRGSNSGQGSEPSAGRNFKAKTHDVFFLRRAPMLGQVWKLCNDFDRSRFGNFPFKASVGRRRLSSLEMYAGIWFDL